MAKQPRSLHGKVVAITGGARGIGLSTAKAFAREGAKVAIGDLELGLTEQSAGTVGSDAIGLELDVTRRDSFEQFVAQVEERLGPIDVIVNNAGIMPLGPFDEESDATARRQVDINVHGVLYGMKIVLPSMKRRNTGHIVNLASQAGKAGFPGGATYCGTKHFVVGASEAVRQELRGTDVEVSCVMPAIVKTELTAGLMESRVVKSSTPEEVADAIVAAVEVPKFDVFVPKGSGALYKVLNTFPRGAREAIARTLKGDKILADPDKAARAAYEERAARSEPGLEPQDAGAAADVAEAEKVES